ncbi:glycosyl transferase [Verrucomicrobiota bacterium]
MNLPDVTVIARREFEDIELLRIRKERTAVEYCWTCTPSIIKYILERYDLGMCTYLDADLYFYADPKDLIAEMDDKSVLITEHRFSPAYDRSADCGKYCVQFLTFKNNAVGMKVLEWWRKACNAWCFDRFEGGKFGDQKYLDDWPERFPCVHVLRNPGGGVAPWNVQQYDFKKASFEIIFFHFHQIKLYENRLIDFGNYKLAEYVINFFYRPYISHLERMLEYVRDIEKPYDACYIKYETDWIRPLRNLRRKLKGVYNVYNRNEFVK